MKQLDTESFQYKVRLFIRTRLTLVGFIFLIFIFGLVMFGPLVSPYDPLAIDFSVKLNPCPHPNISSAPTITEEIS